MVKSDTDCDGTSGSDTQTDQKRTEHDPSSNVIVQDQPSDTEEHFRKHPNISFTDTGTVE